MTTVSEPIGGLLVGQPYEVLTTPPKLPFEAYGVQLAPINTQDWLAVGTVRPLRMVAAIRRVSIEQWGLADGDIGFDAHPFHVADRVQHCRGLFTTDAPAEHSPGGTWYVVWGFLARNNPAAHDVTVWTA